MRCPKCHYLSFDPEPRCRNCGYDLDLPDAGDALAHADLELKAPPPADVPAADLILRDRHDTRSPSGDREGKDAHPQLDELNHPRRRGPFDPPEASAPTRGARTPETMPRPARPPRPSGSTHRRAPAPPPTTELPLFVTEPPQPEDADEIQHSLSQGAVTPEPTPDVPIAPYASIRVQPTAVAGALDEEHVPLPRRMLGPLDRDLLEDLQRLERSEQPPSAHRAPLHEVEDSVGPGSRILAAGIDALVLSTVAAGVLAITLRWCELSVEQIGVLPLAPTAAFLLLVGLGYLLMFTAAGGQTLGKMVAGIRVIGDDASDTHLSAKQIVLRELIALPSALLLGAGLLPALVGDHRAVHDRVSRTRVVRA